MCDCTFTKTRPACVLTLAGCRMVQHGHYEQEAKSRGRAKAVRRCDPPSTKHAVRCCSDTPIASCDATNCPTGQFGYKEVNCAGAKLWVVSDARGADFGGCQRALTFLAATAKCQSIGARLCTYDELTADCTENTGCSFDYELIWSSTNATMENPTGQSSFGVC